ncbi:MAG: hypothetical protein ACP5UH_00890 [Candidatus Micrarchaeia archaeon]
MDFYRIEEIPNKGIDKRVIFDAMGGEPFLVVYDFADRSTVIGIEGNHSLKVQLIHSFIQGIMLSHLPSSAEREFDAEIISCYSSDPGRAFQGAFDLPILKGLMIAVFIPVTEKELSRTKKFMERMLSSKKVRETSSEPRNALGGRATLSSQREIFDDSDEALALNNMLGMINDSILDGGTIYKFFIIIPHGNGIMHNYIRSRFLVLNEKRLKRFTYASLESLRKYPALPFGSKYLSALIGLSGSIKINYTVSTLEPAIQGDLDLGSFASGGVKATERRMRISSSLLNLGFIITGLPGTGKTTEAMAIADQLLLKNPKPKVLIIAPTEEWAGFAVAHGMHLIRLYKDAVPINFFRRPQCISKEKFYENLAMILASASNAGPYQNPMEKCMLNAFRKVYENDDAPDPIDVYDSIEESIIELHAKRTNAGIKYSKHGENIKSALENLRAILSRPEYAAQHGATIEALLEEGVVFDISNASSSTKQYLYALILNQVYAIASGFDTNGDMELRLAIFLEEAQTIFGDKESTAVQDIKQRIQDFRKQGIGLIMLAHNVNDIESGIRRLCQLKLYLRQASDVAPIAAKDLTFALAESEEATLKLKMLESNIGALSYVTLEGKAKVPHDTIFIRTINYSAGTGYEAGDSGNRVLLPHDAQRDGLPKAIDAVISITQPEVEGRNSAVFMRVLFLGESIGTCKITQQGGTVMKLKMLEGKHYTLQLLNKQKHIIKEIGIRAAQKISVSPDATE